MGTYRQANKINLDAAKNENIEDLTKIVRKDLVWVAISTVIAITLGVVAGNLIKF